MPRGGPAGAGVSSPGVQAGRCGASVLSLDLSEPVLRAADTAFDPCC